MKSTHLLVHIILLSIISSSNVYNHGIGGDTLVYYGDNRTTTMRELVYEYRDLNVLSCFDPMRSIVTQAVKSRGKSKIDAYIRLEFDDIKKHDVICSPMQEFYVANTNSWVPAHQLQVGDMLATYRAECQEIKQVALFENRMKVYSIEVEHTHTFFVGYYGVLTHNMFFPWTLTWGLSIPFGMGSAAAGGAAGSFFGPASIIGGIVVGGVAGVIGHVVGCNKPARYRVEFDRDIRAICNQSEKAKENKNSEAQAPGRPTKDDGYQPPKKWEGEKVRHPKTGQYGWPDNRGEVWVAAGPKGHGGPHWDVVDKNGKHRNVVPGGRIRGQE